MRLFAPELLTTLHELHAFDSGEPSLNDWLKQRALRNQANNASRTFVVCTERHRVVGYYALAASAVVNAQAPGHFRRSMPDPIPVVVLGRLAVDLSQQGKGLGRALMQDAARRVINAADTIGIRGMLVHALSEKARAFYEKLGFNPSPLNPLTLMISLGDLRASLTASA